MRIDTFSMRIARRIEQEKFGDLQIRPIKYDTTGLAYAKYSFRNLTLYLVNRDCINIEIGFPDLKSAVRK